MSCTHLLLSMVARCTNLAKGWFKEGQILKSKRAQIKAIFIRDNLQKELKPILKYCMCCSDFINTSLKRSYFLQYLKETKNGLMAKSLNFWKTISKKAKWLPYYSCRVNGERECQWQEREKERNCLFGQKHLFLEPILLNLLSYSCN